jgi:hypothetical protein
MEWRLEVLGIILFGLIVSSCASDGVRESTSVSERTDTSALGFSDSPPTSSPAKKVPSLAEKAPTSAQNRDRIASGAVEDTLEKCLARIPPEASVGQKMLAEQGCRRDHLHP